MEMRTGLEGKPWYYGALAGLFVAGGLYFAASYWLINPQKDELKKQNTNLTGLQARIQEGQAAARELPRFREEVRSLELELDRLLRILPARRNTPELLRRIRALTEQGDFVLRGFKPGNFVDQEFYSEWPISISLEGTYHNLGLFFDRVSRFSRIVNIEGLKIGNLKGGSVTRTIAATFRAKTFIYKEPAPETPAAGGGQ